MTFTFIHSKPGPSNIFHERRHQIKKWMQLCRTGTLKLFEGTDYNTFCRQAHPDFSPIGWHLGHIAYIESLWLLVHCAGIPLTKVGFAHYQRLFTADGLSKGERVYLPTFSEVCCYLNTVRKQVFDYLEVAPLDEQERLWYWLLQHESQHSEIIFFVLQLQRPTLGIGKEQNLHSSSPQSLIQTPLLPIQEMIEIPGGEFEMGNDTLDSLDNERPVHCVTLDTYWIDRYPVTCEQYQAFMEAGGYHNPIWWSTSGWEWLQVNAVTQPLYWQADSAKSNHPVCGVSWYEAEAYARFVGKRLPTEAEWEKAASWNPVDSCRRTYPWGEVEPSPYLCNHHHSETLPVASLQTTPVNAYPQGQSAYGCYDMLGNVWEWTASWFDSYEGFVSYPYAGYSKAYFDQQHRVLKGGSLATRPWALRSSFRNWYYPEVRQIISGFRCAFSEG